MQKKWNVKKIEEEKIQEIKSKYKVSDILAKLLVARDIEINDIEGYLNANLDNLENPFMLKDMDKFIDRVLIAIEKKERICIYGDYDVDGITSIVIMYKFLKGIGADVIYYLPDRLLEGYGMNNQALDIIKNQGVSLVITVDCGITAIDETKYAKSIGIDVCITDHHECSENLPNVMAIVNPKQKEDTYPFKMLAGVGVAFKCITALSEKLNIDASHVLKYLDIVAIGTISDIVPLVNENRIISKYGLNNMQNTQNEGLKALLKIISYKDMDSTMVSFGMAPRINACGRMGNASLAVELLLEQDETLAFELAQKLDELNNKRQIVEKNIFDEAVKTIEENNLDKNNSILLYNPDWHNGVIGIVASRLVNMYYKPVILLTKEQDVIRGSGRCQVGVSLYDILTKCSMHLIQFGGHELAAGLSIEEEKISDFRIAFEEAVSQIEDLISEQIIDIDVEIKGTDLNAQIIKDIQSLKPFGQSNKVPLFIYKNLKVNSIRTIKDEKHLKLVLQDGKYLLEAIAFSQGSRRDELKVGDKINVVCNVEVNTYNTPKTIQLLLVDFKKVV